jgi:hypothetical protein
VYDLWAGNPVLRVANDMVAVWILLTCLRNELLRERLTLLIVGVNGSYDPGHEASHGCTDCD